MVVAAVYAHGKEAEPDVEPVQIAASFEANCCSIVQYCMDHLLSMGNAQCTSSCAGSAQAARCYDIHRHDGVT